MFETVNSSFTTAKIKVFILSLLQQPSIFLTTELKKPKNIHVNFIFIS